MFFGACDLKQVKSQDRSCQSAIVAGWYSSVILNN